MTDRDPIAQAGGLLAAWNCSQMLEEEKDRHRAEKRRLLLRFLDVLDGLQALEAYCAELVEQGQTGVPHRSVTLLTEQMLAVFAEAGVRPLPALGQPVDLSRHDVSGTQPSDAVEPDTVLQEEERGYLWNDQLLRRARVVASRLPRPDERTSP